MGTAMGANAIGRRWEMLGISLQTMHVRESGRHVVMAAN
jgi:hypothetical protein